MCKNKSCQWTIPKKFLCRYELKLGAKIYGILMILVMIACIIGASVEMAGFKFCDTNSYSVKRSAYAFGTITLIVSILMIIIHCWFLWGVKKSKASVVIVWVVVNGLWLVQTAFLTIVLLCLYMADTSFLAWIMALVFGIIAFIICLYGVMVGYGLWLELKGARQAAANPS